MKLLKKIIFILAALSAIAAGVYYVSRYFEDHCENPDETESEPVKRHYTRLPLNS
ncbi:MAG: hypothetical protein PUB13_01375 [Lachnospiraceae bacterium]|nr:hypothetical protein [Lachnospiraceae bacterium]